MPAPSDTRFLSSAGRRLHPSVISALMQTAVDHPGILSLAAGFTDTATLPVDLVGDAVQHLGDVGEAPEHLQYGAPQGRAGLLELLARRTNRLDGDAAGAAPTLTMIGNGSQQLLYMAMQVLCDPGDIVLVERPTYFVFLEMLAGLGVRAEPLPAAEDGRFDFDGIRRRLRELRGENAADRVKAVYLMGYFANPSALSRSEAEKEQLAEVLREVGLIVPVIEDAAYRELWFEAPWPARSILALEAFEPFPRLYCGTLTKPFASGLKIGYLHASSPAIFERMLWLKGHQDFGSAHFNQAILEHVIRSGGFDAFLARLRPGYASKMDTLDRALEEAGLRALGWRWERPAGGLYLWVRAPEGVSTELNGPLWKACVEEEVMYVPGGLCIAGPADSRHVRLSFGVLDHAALREAAARFARAARRAAPRRA